MSLLTELVKFVESHFYKYAAPTALVVDSKIHFAETPARITFARANFL
jgi:hypothetical protein